MPIWLCVFKIFYNISYAHFSQLNIGCVYIYYLFLCLFFSPLAISDEHMEGASARRSHTLNSLPLSLSLSLTLGLTFKLSGSMCVHSLWLHFISSFTVRLNTTTFRILIEKITFKRMATHRYTDISTYIIYLTQFSVQMKAGCFVYSVFATHQLYQFGFV